MNTRQEWLNNTDYTFQFYSAEETINEVKENFDIRRFYSAEGADVSVDGINCRALIQYFTNPLNQVKYDRKLHVPMEININTGSIIDYDGFKWLVTGSVDDIQAYKTAGMVKCNNIINLTINHIQHQIPCIIGSNLNLGIDENKYIIEPDSNIIVRLQNNEITSQIKRNEIYKLGIENYSVIDISDILENGILILKMEYSQESQEEHVYQLTILNGDNIQIAQSQLLTINSELKDNGVIVPSPALLYSSSNESIATISNIGEVTILGLGTVTFTVLLESNLIVNDSINVEIVADEQNNFTVTISGESSIIKNYTKEYSATFKNNGLPIVKESIFWLTGTDDQPTTFAIITSQDATNNTCNIRGDSLGYVKLWVKSVDDEIIMQNGMLIQIKNLF